nr:hypothetical protein [Leuven wasp-associated virus 5]
MLFALFTQINTINTLNKYFKMSSYTSISSNFDHLINVNYKLKSFEYCDEFGKVIVMNKIINGYDNFSYFRYIPIYEYSIWTKKYEFVTFKLVEANLAKIDNVYNVLDISDKIEDIPIQCDNHLDDLCCLYSRAISKIKVDKMSIHDYNQLVDKFLESQSVKVRSIMLLTKLKYIINSLKDIRLGQVDCLELREMTPLIERVCEAIDYKEEVIQAEMNDETAVLQTDNKLVIDSHSTTALTSHQAPDKDVASSKQNNDLLMRASCGDGIRRFPFVTERWVPIFNFEWNTTHTSANILAQLDFMSLLTSSGQANTPLYSLMSMFTYLQADMEFLVHLNSTKFHIGQLLCGFYYSSAMDLKASSRYIAAGLIQMPHIKINANTANDGVLYIPFKYYKPMIALKKNTGNTSDMQNYGTFVCLPLSRLQCVSGSSSSVHVNVFVRLVNAQFSGLNAKSFFDKKKEEGVEAEMMSIKTAVNLASDTLDVIMPDGNRDAPPNSSVCIRNIPTITSNWNTGAEGVFDVNVMRLSEVAQTPHPPGTTSSDDSLDLLQIAQKPGLYHQVKWTKDMAYDALIFSDDVSPMGSHKLETYENVLFVVSEKSGNVIKIYKIMPPLYNIMSCINFWRGSLIYDFEVICSDFHTGTLIIAFIPGLAKRTTGKYNIDLMKSCYYATFDIRENKNFSFRVPYIADKPWWPRLLFYDDESKMSYRDSIGTLMVRVMNPMVISNTVPTDVDINIYIRAGPDFEFSVLSQPLLSLNYDVVANHDDNVFIKDGYYPDMITDTWHYLPSNKFVFRYGEGSDHITQFTPNMKPTEVYKVIYDPSLATRIMFINKNVSVVVQYIVCVIVNGDKDMYRYATGFADLPVAKRFAEKNADWVDSTYSLMMDFTKPYKVTGSLGSIYFAKVVTDSDEEFEFAEAQMDTELIDVSSANSVSLEFGRLTFGESFSSLKSILRRFNWEADLMFPIIDDKEKSDYYNLATVQIPISLSGLSFDSSHYTKTMLRHNTITYLTSCFRFGRGGVRYRFVFPKIPITVMFQHVILPTTKARTVVYHPTPNSDYESHIKSGYTLCVQSLDVNNIVSLEIPYYSPGSFIVNGIPNVAIKSDIMHHTLGHILISIDSSKYLRDKLRQLDPRGIPFKVYRALADDFSLSCYVGFPPCIQNVEFAKAEMDDEVQPEMIGIARWAFNATVDPVATGSDLLKGIVKDASEDIKDTIVQVVGDAKQELIPNGILQSAANLFPDISRTTMISALVTILNCALNPNIRTFIVNVVSFFVQIGILASECMSSVVKAFVGFINQLLFKTKNKMAYTTRFAQMMKKYKQEPYIIKTGTSTNQQSQVLEPNKPIRTMQMSNRIFDYMIVLYEQEKKDYLEKSNVLPGDVQSEGPEDHLGTIASVCLSGILTAFSIKSNLSQIKKIPNFATILLRDIKEFSLTANHMMLFFRNTSDMFCNMFKWVMNFGSEKDLIYSNIVNNSELINKWIDECHWCLDEVNADKIRLEPSAILKVYYCAYFGEQIRKMYYKSDSRVQNRMRNLEILIKQIIAKRDLLTNNRLAPEVRSEPFVLCLEGDSNVGKSHITDKIGYDIAVSEKWVIDGNHIYTRTPGNPFMNGYRNPKIVRYDDFLQVRAEPFSLNDVGEFFCFKSSAKYNVPMAELNQKEIHANPKMLILCTNNPFPIINGISSMEAFYRRRDMLVKMRRKAQYVNISIQDIPVDVRDSYAHVEFYIRKNVLQDEIIDDSEWIDYAQFYKEFLARYRKFDELEQKNYLQRIDRIMELQSNSNVYDLAAIQIEFEKIVQISSAFDESANDEINEKIQKAIDRSLIRHDQLSSELYCKTDTNVMHDIMESLNLAGEMESEQEHECWHTAKLIKQFIDHPKQFVFMDSESTITHFKAGLMSKDLQDVVLNNTDVEKMFKSGVFFNYLSKEFMPVNSCLEECGDCKNEISFNDYVKWFEGQDALDRVDILETVETNMADRYVPTKYIYKMRAYLRERTKDSDSVRREVCGVRQKFSKFEWVCSKLKSVFKILSTVALGFASILSLFFLFKYFAGKCRVGVSNDIIHSLDSGSKHGKLDGVGCEVSSPEMSYSQYNTKNVPTQQGAIKLIRGEMAEEVMNNVQRRIKRNTVIFRCTRSNGSVDLRAIGITGTKCLIVDHMYEHMRKVYKEGGTIVMYIGGIAYNMPESGLKASFVEDSVFVILEILLTIPHFCNLIKLMQNVKSSAMNAPTGYLIEPVLDGKNINLNIHHQHYIEQVNNIIINAPSGTDLSDSFSSKCYAYQTSGKGKCMSVLIADVNSPTPIIGFHVAGRVEGGRGFAECVVLETFKPVITSYIKDIAVAEMGPVEFSSIKTDSNLIKIGAIPKPFIQRMPEKCKNIHSLLYNEIYPSTYDFPVISPKDPRIKGEFSPLVKGIENQSRPPISFSKQLIDSAKKNLMERILMSVHPVIKQDLLTDEQVVCGEPSDRNLFPHLDFTTSEGFPYSKYRPIGCTNKKWLFDLIETEDGYTLNGINDMVTQIREVKYKQRVNGIVPFTLFVDSLKDLKMPKEKCCIPGKTRVFSASPIDFTLDTRKYFGSFVASYTNARFRAEHAVGINVNRFEWHELAMHLLNNSECIITGDYKNFGPTLMSACVDAAFDIIIAWYDEYFDHFYNDSELSEEELNKLRDEHRLIRQIMGYEMRFSTHLARDLVYQVITGSPSGSPLTVVLNNLVNGLYIRCIYLILTENTEFYGLDKFDKNVQAVFYGDDLIMSVKEDVLQYFNGKTIQEAFALYNITFTDSIKTGDIKLCSKITDPETTFLKRRFIIHPVRKCQFFSLGDERSIVEIGNWIFETKNPVLATQQAVEQMLEAAYSLGESKYNEICGKVRQAVRNYYKINGVLFTIRICSWEDIDRRNFGVN